jgi:surfeit locus 1 family protein
MASPRLVAFGVVTAAAAALCVRLGFWQLDRLEQRRSRNADITARGAEPPLPFAALRGADSAAVHWRRVTVEGVADYAHEVVHAARSQAGAPGVHLLTPLTPVGEAWGDTAVLLLRGFVYAADGRTVERAKAREADTVRLEALVTVFPPKRPGPVRLDDSAGAVRLLDPDTIAAMVGRPLAPVVLLALGDTAPRDIVRPMRVPPPKLGDGPHLSYALQWFGFALVALAGFAAYARSASRSATGGRGR